VRASRPYLSDRAKTKTVGSLHPGNKQRQRDSLANTAKHARDLRTAVVANAKALDAVKNREFGYWQTTNSVLNGADPSEHMGESFNDLNDDQPVLIHLNNLHSCNGPIPPDPNTASEHVPVPDSEQQGACHLLRASGPAGWAGGAKDGLVREFEIPKVFAVNGVLQKQKRTGPHMYPMVGYAGQDPQEAPFDTPLIPIPNGKKVRWGGVDLQFRIEGALQDTQFDFYMVKCNKEQPLVWDPWHQTINPASRSIPGVLPYTINDFRYLHHEMYPKKLDTARYEILSHRRVWVNNVHRVTGQHALRPVLPDNAKYATGNVNSHTPTGDGLTSPIDLHPTHLATTNMTQSLRMSYKPNKILRPLRNFIGERLDTPMEQRGSHADANPLEKATLGTMSWDNFHPSANVWLVMTTNHKTIKTERIEGPYSHQGYAMVAAPSTATHGKNKEPESYTAWTSTLSDGRPGSNIRETQLQYLLEMYGAHGTSGHGAQGQHPDYLPGGKFYDEWLTLVNERLDRDAYRNPRIHIFRRTWWQDEHIPTELSEADALTEAEAKMQPTATAPTTPAPATPAAIASIQGRFRAGQRRAEAYRRQPEFEPMNTESDNPGDWTPHPSGHAKHDATWTIPTEFTQFREAFKLDAGLCDQLGINRWQYTLLQRLANHAMPPTAEQSMRVGAKRQRGGYTMSASSVPWS